MKIAYQSFLEKLKEIKGLKIMAFITMSIYIICIYAFILSIQDIVDVLTTQGVNDFQLSSLSYMAILLVIVSIVSYVSQYVFNLLPVRAKNIFLNKIFLDVLEKDVSVLKEYGQEKLFSLLVNDAVSFTQIVSLNSVVFSYQLLTIVLCMILLFYTQWILSCILLVCVLLCFLFTNVLTKRIAKNHQAVFESKENMTKYILEGLKHHKVIYLLSKQNLFSNKFQSFLKEDLEKKERKQSLYQSQYVTVYVLLTIVLPFLSIILGLYFVSCNVMSLGQVLTIYLLTSQLQEPIRQIANVRTQYLSAVRLAQRMEILLHEQKQAELLIDKVDTIQVQDISFSYHKDSILHHVTMSFGKEHVAIQGASGCGKSTLLSLLMGFEKVDKGKVLIDGNNINDINKKNYYQYILYVEQNPYIFHDTLINNIMLYDDFCEGEIEEVMRVCQLVNFYKETQDDIIDQNKISGGQAQRISIARMLLRKPNILLLDEPTSALDEQTSMAFTQELQVYCEKYHIYLVVVSHKADVISICTKKLNMKRE